MHFEILSFSDRKSFMNVSLHLFMLLATEVEIFYIILHRTLSEDLSFLRKVTKHSYLNSFALFQVLQLILIT